MPRITIEMSAEKIQKYFDDNKKLKAIIRNMKKAAEFKEFKEIENRQATMQEKIDLQHKVMELEQELTSSHQELDEYRRQVKNQREHINELRKLIENIGDCKSISSVKKVINKKNINKLMRILPTPTFDDVDSLEDLSDLYMSDSEVNAC